ncbi:hypothetical protein WJX72_000109 [[Myrmecia] bisecta]|uniref:Uncharacterized protein n=1 Tax=[Myrmecia] bisecta TaxID=41462 RepID=A0AAW1Q365_9CHLO
MNRVTGAFSPAGRSFSMQLPGTYAGGAQQAQQSEPLQSLDITGVGAPLHFTAEEMGPQASPFANGAGIALSSARNPGSEAVQEVASELLGSVMCPADRLRAANRQMSPNVGAAGVDVTAGMAQPGAGPLVELAQRWLSESRAERTQLSEQPYAPSKVLSSNRHTDTPPQAIQLEAAPCLEEASQAQAQAYQASPGKGKRSRRMALPSRRYSLPGPEVAVGSGQQAHRQETEQAGGHSKAANTSGDVERRKGSRSVPGMAAGLPRLDMPGSGASTAAAATRVCSGSEDSPCLLYPKTAGGHPAFGDPQLAPMLDANLAVSDGSSFLLGTYAEELCFLAGGGPSGSAWASQCVGLSLDSCPASTLQGNSMPSSHGNDATASRDTSETPSPGLGADSGRVARATQAGMHPAGVGYQGAAVAQALDALGGLDVAQWTDAGFGLDQGSTLEDLGDLPADWAGGSL